MWTLPPDLAPATRAQLAALPVREVPRGAVLFRPGDVAQAFVVVLSGRIEVRLTAASGREILLYAVEPGESCIQTTLGLLGDDPYSGEATAALASRLVLIPKAMFVALMDGERSFRQAVLHAFGQRMADLTRVLEQVAFGRVEVRLAQALLDLAEGDLVRVTQAELAARIGSAREVVSRRLEQFARNGWTLTERGQVRLTDPAALRGLADQGL